MGCCGMNPVIYDKLVESLNERSKEHTQSLSGSTSLDQNPEDAPAYIFDTKLLNSELSDKVRLCVKNYGQLKGVSTALHAFNSTKSRDPWAKGCVSNKQASMWHSLRALACWCSLIWSCNWL